jgi:hypothetical protein
MTHPVIPIISGIMQMFPVVESVSVVNFRLRRGINESALSYVHATISNIYST